jgi:hypothetical protein
MAAVWTFLNSPLGMALILSVLGKLFVTAVKEKPRRDKILEYAKNAFDMAEMIGVRQGLGGNAKYLVYVEQIVQMLRARGEKELSIEERKLVERLAEERAWITKKP